MNSLVCCTSTKCESGSSIMTRVLVHLVLHCVFSTRRATEGHTLRVRMHACAICHCMQCTSTMCKSGDSTYFTTPRCECTERAQVHVRHGKEPLWHIYGMPGVKGQTLGGPGARPSTTDTVCLIWPKGQRSKSAPEPAPH